MEETYSEESPQGAERKDSLGIPHFRQTLSTHHLTMEREETRTLQVNVGLVCNQACRHCHLEAGPGRQEAMDRETVEEVVAYAGRGGFETVDITGGAPELNPHLERLLRGCSEAGPRVMLRSNLTALTERGRDELLGVCKDLRVTLVASFPALNEAQTDAQRGGGVFQASVEALKRLNAEGFGREGTGLELDLVSNPSGAFLPTPQEQAEARFRRVLETKWGITFNRLFSFANVPLGRFRAWLQGSGNLQAYLERLASRFNPCAVQGVMCRTLVSVSWEGFLYDCDFNLARGIPLGGRRRHVREMQGPPTPGTPIAVADHCYTCTAGAGFT